MKINTINILSLLGILFCICFVSCGDDDAPDSVFDYSINIESPNTDAKKVGDMLPIKVEFVSGTGMTIHNVNVKIYNAADTTLVAYDQPEEMHVHQDGGSYVYEDVVMLSHDNGFHTHGDWILSATVSGHDGVEEVVEELEFHVHPADEVDFAYHAHIKMPLADIVSQGSILPIEVEFESHTGQPVHHINVKIYNKSDNSEIMYNLPSDSHVHIEEGSYDYSDELELTAENFEIDSEWIMEAKVWGPDGDGEVTEIKEFKIGS